MSNVPPYGPLYADISESTVNVSGVPMPLAGLVSSGIYSMMTTQVQDGSTNYSANSTYLNGAYEAVYDPAITAYVPGVKLSFLIAATNMGSGTFDAGAGAAPIIGPVGALQGGEMASGYIATVQYDNGNWQLLYGGGAVQVGPAMYSEQAVQQGQVIPMVSGYVQETVPPWIQEQSGNYAQDTGAVNAIAVMLNPAPMSLADLTGAPIRIKLLYTVTGETTVNVNGFGPVSLGNPNGSAIVPNQMMAGGIYTVVYDGTGLFMLQSISGSVGIPQVYIVGAASTLTIAQNGEFVEITGTTTYTTTLPTPAGNQGVRFTFWNNSPTPSYQTLATPTGYFYGPGGSAKTTMNIQYYVVLTLESDGYNWIVVNAASSTPREYYYLNTPSGAGMTSGDTYNINSCTITFPAFSRTGSFRINVRISANFNTNTAESVQNYQNKVYDGTNTLTGASWLVSAIYGGDYSAVGDTMISSATYSPGETVTFTQQVYAYGGENTFYLNDALMYIFTEES